MPADSEAPAIPDGDVATEASLEPLASEPIFTNLAVPGFPEAVVSVPSGATTRRPVLVVLHGSGDRPDWNCDAWRHITHAQGFVLCPRGEFVAAESTKDDRRFTHRGGDSLRAHVDAALAALASRFGPYVDVERPLAAGFSLGAMEIAELALGDPDRFPRVAAIEGGDRVWTALAGQSFAAHGGVRVLFGCGSSWCLTLAKAAATRIDAGHGELKGARAGPRLEARLVYARVGHTTDRLLQEAIMGELAWWLEGDPRWSAAR